MLKVKELHILDSAGRPRIVLSSDKDYPRLLLRDEHGRDRVYLSVSGTLSLLSMSDSSGISRVSWSDFVLGSGMTITRTMGGASLAVGIFGPDLQMSEQSGKRIVDVP